MEMALTLDSGDNAVHFPFVADLAIRRVWTFSTGARRESEHYEYIGKNNVPRDTVSVPSTGAEIRNSSSEDGGLPSFVSASLLFDGRRFPRFVIAETDFAVVFFVLFAFGGRVRLLVRFIAD
jgi:hypothetical protein